MLAIQCHHSLINCRRIMLTFSLSSSLAWELKSFISLLIVGLFQVAPRLVLYLNRTVRKLFTTRQRSGEGYVFSCVCPSFCSSGGGGSAHECNWISLYRASDLPVKHQPPPPRGTPTVQHHLSAITGDMFKLVWEPPPTSTDIWWLLKHVQLASGRYAFYWKVFLSLPAKFGAR